MKLRGLRQARQRSGLSIGQLAEQTGLRRDTISHLEHGQEDPQSYAVRRLATALGASVSDLYGLPLLEGQQSDTAEPHGPLTAAG